MKVCYILNANGYILKVEGDAAIALAEGATLYETWEDLIAENPGAEMPGQ